MTITFPTDRLAKLLLPGPTGSLEVMTTSPETHRNPPTIAVICHPHPLFGGTHATIQRNGMEPPLYERLLRAKMVK